MKKFIVIQGAFREGIVADKMFTETDAGQVHFVRYGKGDGESQARGAEKTAVVVLSPGMIIRELEAGEK